MGFLPTGRHFFSNTSLVPNTSAPGINCHYHAMISHEHSRVQHLKQCLGRPQSPPSQRPGVHQLLLEGQGRPSRDPGLLQRAQTWAAHHCLSQSPAQQGRGVMQG